MLKDFIGAIEKYGIPSRVRADKGGEFAHINSLMEEINGDNRGSFLKGKSVHNVRIERLWRDVFTKIMEKFYNIFNLMEDKNILDINNETHMACLHHVFGKRIQALLSIWMSAHNNHPIRTEKSSTPTQLWYCASMKQSNTSHTAMTNLFCRDPNDYAPILDQYKNHDALVEPDSIVHVLPRFLLPLSVAKLNELNVLTDVLQESTCDGIDVYGKVMRFVYDNLGL